MNNVFSCDQCSNDDVPLERLERSNLRDGNAFNKHSDACFCSVECRDTYDDQIKRNIAYHRLIAAAPDLLKAAKAAYEEFAITKIGNMLLAAIEKAEGKD